MTDARHTERILKKRAQLLAREVAAPQIDETVEIVEFLLAGENYGIETSYVREVFPFKDLTPVPGTPGFFAGIVNVRGKMIVVVDLRILFALAVGGLQDLHKVLILQTTELSLGLLIDEVKCVGTVPVGRLQTSLPTLTGIRRDYIRGVDDSGLVVLDAGRLLADERLIVNDDVT